MVFFLNNMQYAASISGRISVIYVHRRRSMKTTLNFLFIFLFSAGLLNAQSTNIDCSSALELENVSNYCSANGEFDSDDVGDSGVEVPSCWAASNNDLWFTFVAQAKSVNIVVDGNSGTMDNPEIILYSGDDCGSLLDINSCEINSSSIDITSLNNFNLEIGQRYYIRVDGRSSGNDGSFQLCVNNFNPPTSPGQDCNTASLLCNKDAFTVLNVTGEGLVENEADGTCLDIGPNGSENRSVWYKWTCSVAGTLTFDILPISPDDDYDFGVFELPDGINSCNKNIIRCGATDGGDGASCGPETGLDLVSTDTEEDLNCELDEDGYLRFIDMVAGRSYALLINNFSSSELGFNITFGGTGEFEGPEADFEIAIDDSDPCSPTVVVTDQSDPGVFGVSQVTWNFGEGASPETADGPGPFTVSYTDFGEKVITQEVISDGGCIVYSDSTILIDQCLYTEALSLEIVDLQGVGCGSSGGGRLELAPSISCGIYTYSANGVPAGEPIFENLEAGDVTVSIIDQNGCTIDSVYNIPSIAEFTVDAGDDVTITDVNVGVMLDASTTATTDVTVSWSPDTGLSCTDGTSNCLNPTVIISEEMTYIITVTDENGCLAMDTVVVATDICGASDFVLDPGDDLTLNIPGDTVDVNVGSQGSADITVNWTPSEPIICSDGSTNCLNPRIAVSETTTFTINVVDALGCSRTEMLTIVVPDFCSNTTLAIQLDSLRGDYCDGALASFIEVSGLGGNPDYEFSIDGGDFSETNMFTALEPGQYRIDVRDAFNCVESIFVDVEEIPGFNVDAGEDIIIDGSEPFDMLGASHDADGPVSISWSPEMDIFCVDTTTNCLNPSVNPSLSTTYTITVVDENGCSASDQVNVIVEERTGIFPPNIFSPNEDGVNDIFSILGDPTIVDIIEQLNVYDRWGNLVYSGRDLSPTDENAGWDGRVNGNAAQQGVYTWFADVLLFNTVPGETGLVKTVKGDITLIR